MRVACRLVRELLIIHWLSPSPETSQPLKCISREALVHRRLDDMGSLILDTVCHCHRAVRQSKFWVFSIMVPDECPRLGSALLVIVMAQEVSVQPWYLVVSEFFLCVAAPAYAPHRSVNEALKSCTKMEGVEGKVTQDTSKCSLSACMSTASHTFQYYQCQILQKLHVTTESEPQLF